MSHTPDPVAVPLHGIFVVDGRPVASRKVKGDFFHSAPHLAEARTHVPVVTNEDKFDNTPDFAPAPGPDPSHLTAFRRAHPFPRDGLNALAESGVIDQLPRRSRLIRTLVRRLA